MEEYPVSQPDNSSTVVIPAVHLLPAELLSQVFEELLDQRDSFEYQLGPCFTPLVLSQLWRRIHVSGNVYGRPLRTLGGFSNLMESFMARASGHTIQLSFELFSKLPMDSKEYTDSWRFYMARSQSLMFEDAADLLQLFFHSPFQQPLLEDLSIWCSGDEFTDILPCIIAPSLHHLVVSSFPRPNGNNQSLILSVLSLLEISGCRLEVLDLECIDIIRDGDELYQLLKAVPSLVSLTLRGAYNVPPTAIGHLLWPLVHREDQSSQYLVPLLRRLSLSLELVVADDHMDRDVTNILHLRQSSEFSMASLEWAVITVDEWDEREWQWEVRPGTEGIIKTGQALASDSFTP
ncbi:hypothetical protein GLOTRDRAFT_94681 [Gloeophyllum trabeum ATCC 11539]|uniref:F-box domain-containing protein n=1 Tax=Gloeophyllum trabeum (strain ATCC 11539 / FP-39264 / Madison 617) TaxID=670483 RepID=S7RGS7_GLOTA|nr:uncharacterized protein GLOTRDRAFT_94681 [Gloeophyllum trabeum ATCC 11539]EPQ53420.1 hypothetical protein GLOTRDRAFT_94681 [Gloeophyllum trabeum ATCC 11539]